MIKVILPAVMLLVLLAGGGGLYVLYETLQGKKTTISTTGDNSNVSAGGTAFRMLFENATGQVTKTPDIDLRGQMPPAPSGWFARAYTQEDGETIVEAKLIKTMVSKSTTNDILLDFRRSDQAGAGGETKTYMRGKMLMALRMQRLQQVNTNTVQGQILGEINANISAMGDIDSVFNSGKPSKSLFARADGIDWIEHPRTSRRPATGEITPVNYRRFTAKIGTFIELEIITNAADAHVAALIRQIDMAALNALLPSPAPNYRAGVGVHTAKAELSAEPPGKSMAMIAYETLNDGRIYQPSETRVLQRIAEGDITDWDSAIKRSGPGIAVTETLLKLLGAEPDHIKVKRLAYALTNGDTPVEGRAMHFVRAIAGGDIKTQSEARNWYYFDEVEMTDGIRDLIRLLPEGEAEQSAQNETASGDETTEEKVKPTVRRGAQGGNLEGSDCKIELGVRRCVLTEDEQDQ